MRLFLVAVVTAVVTARSVSGASFSIGPEGISSSPINLGTVIRTLRNVWHAFSSGEESDGPATPAQRRHVSTVTVSDYDSTLAGLKSRIEAASTAAATAAEAKERVARKRGQKIHGQKTVEEPALTRAIFAKKKIKVSKWPIVYGLLNIGLIVAIIVLAVPYFKEGETIVDEYSKKKKKTEEEEDEALYALYSTDSSVYGDDDGYGVGPAYPLSKNGYRVDQAQSKFYDGSRDGNDGQVFAVAPYPNGQQPPQPYRQFQQPYRQPQQPYRQPQYGALSNHAVGFDDGVSYIGYDDLGGSSQGLVYGPQEGSPLDEHSPLYARSGEAPINELNYFNPTIFTSVLPSSYGCLESMVCQDPARSGRALEQLRAASGEMVDKADWQAAVTRIDRAAQVGRETGDCAVYFCPPQLPTSEIFERGDSYSPPPTGNVNVDTRSGSHSIEHNVREAPVVYGSVSPNYLFDEGVSSTGRDGSGFDETSNEPHAVSIQTVLSLTTERTDAEKSKEHSTTPTDNRKDMLLSGQELRAAGVPGRASIVELIHAPRIQRPIYHSKVSDHSGTVGLSNELPAPVVIGTSSVVSMNSRHAKSGTPNYPYTKVDTHQTAYVKPDTANQGIDTFKSKLESGDSITIEYPFLSADTTTRFISEETG